MQLHDPELLHWQEAVQKAILSPTSDLKAQLACLLRMGGAGPQQRIGVYVDAYVLRLAEALRTNYPALHQLLGDNEFDRMACHYLAAHPSSHTSIRWFGQQLSTFLRTESPYANIPSIAELAEFEWALRHTIDAADAALITLETLQAIEPESWATLTFSLHPALSILLFEWNSPQIWSALVADEQVPDPAPNPCTGWYTGNPIWLVDGAVPPYWKFMPSTVSIVATVSPTFVKRLIMKLKILILFHCSQRPS